MVATPNREVLFRQPPPTPESTPRDSEFLCDFRGREVQSGPAFLVANRNVALHWVWARSILVHSDARKYHNSNELWITDPYVRQLLTDAALYQERSGKTPVRCVLFFVNEPKPDRQLLAIPVDPSVIKTAEDWTIDQVRQLRGTVVKFQNDPMSVDGGNLEVTQFARRTTH